VVAVSIPLDIDAIDWDDRGGVSRGQLLTGGVARVSWRGRHTSRQRVRKQRQRTHPDADRVEPGSCWWRRHTGRESGR
jgi:hypothetical protein